MPAKLKAVKSKSAPKKAHAKNPAKKSKVVKRSGAKPKLKLVGKSKPTAQPSAKKSKKVSPPQAPNFFRQLLDAKQKEREARQKQDQHSHDLKANHNLNNDKHARFGRYNGPRRRAS